MRIMIKNLFGYSLLLFVFGCILALSNSKAQTVVISETTFDFPPSTPSNFTYISLPTTPQTGVAPGNLTTPLNLPSTTLDKFKNGTSYVVVKNPIKIDSSLFKDIPDGMFVFSQVGSSSTAPFLTYTVGSMVPGTPVTVTIDYQNVIDPTKLTTCGSTISSFKFLMNDASSDNSIRVDKDAPQPAVGGTGKLVVTGTTDAQGNVIIQLRQDDKRQCTIMGISHIKVEGQLSVTGYSEQGSQICAKELLTLKPSTPYNGSYQWQYLKGGNWTNLDKNPSQSFATDAVGTYQFRYIFTPTGSTQTVTSSTISVDAIQCCEDPVTHAASSRTTIYYDDFGTLKDLTGNTFLVWDYSVQGKPKQVPVPATSPSRRSLASEGNEPVGTTFSPSGPILDYKYAVVANMTQANLDWARNITGLATTPTIGLDHSGKPEGAALLINVPDAVGTLYTRQIKNLCVTNGSKVFFECYITVFTHDLYGVNIGVKLNGGGSDVIVNAVANAQGTDPNGGVWVPIRASVDVVGTNPTLTLTIINNVPKNSNGNDLVIDDIKVMACAPPSIDLVFDKTLLKRDSVLCKDFSLFSLVTDNLRQFYGVNNIAYLYQWTKTPTDNTTWKNIGGPILGTAGETKAISDPTSISPLSENDKIYFRVVTASTAILNSPPTDGFSKDDPCRKYSVSDAIIGTYKCPSCNKPQTVIASSTPGQTGSKPKVVDICEGTTAKLLGGYTKGGSNSSLANSYYYSWYKINTPANTPTYTKLASNTTPIAEQKSVADLDSGLWVLRVADFDGNGQPPAACYTEDTIKLKVRKKITNNLIQADQTICYNTAPKDLIQKASTTLGGDYATPATYEWKSSTTNGAIPQTSTTIGTQASYTSGALIKDTYFVRYVKAAGGVCHDTISNVVKITVKPDITGNTITPATQTICSGNTPSITGTDLGAGFRYVWLRSDPSTPTKYDSVASGKDLPSTEKLENLNVGTNVTYHYERVAVNGTCKNTSTPVDVVVNGGMSGGEISKAQIICQGLKPDDLTDVKQATVGTAGTVKYIWETSATDKPGSWTEVAGSTDYKKFVFANALTDSIYVRRKAIGERGNVIQQPHLQLRSQLSNRHLLPF